MSVKIKPVGSKIIVKSIESKETETLAGIVVMDFELERGIVVEVSKEYSDRYTEGDIVIYPKGSGITLPNYKKTNHIWLDGRPSNEGGDIWGIETQEND